MRPGSKPIRHLVVGSGGRRAAGRLEQLRNCFQPDQILMDCGRRRRSSDRPCRRSMHAIADAPFAAVTDQSVCSTGKSTSTGAESSNRPLPAGSLGKSAVKTISIRCGSLPSPRRDAPMILADRPRRGRNAVGAHMDQMFVRREFEQAIQGAGRLEIERGRAVAMPVVGTRHGNVGQADARLADRFFHRFQGRLEMFGHHLAGAIEIDWEEIRERIFWAAARNSIRSLPN